jgi:hypothetical protein
MYLGQRIMAAGMEGVAFQHASAGKQKGFKERGISEMPATHRRYRWE